MIRARDLSIIYIAGPGHGGPGVVANAYLEGTYSEIYPAVSQDEAGMKRLFNDLDRFHLVGDVIDRVPGLGTRMAYVKQMLRDQLIEHKEYITKYGDDMPAIRDWTWE